MGSEHLSPTKDVIVAVVDSFMGMLPGNILHGSSEGPGKRGPIPGSGTARQYTEVRKLGYP